MNVDVDEPVAFALLLHKLLLMVIVGPRVLISTEIAVAAALMVVPLV